jgi:hypothetical protein
VKHRSRLEQAERLGVAAGALAVGQPLRQVAAGLGVAPSTLRGWRATVPGNEMLAGVLAAVSTDPGGCPVAAPLGGAMLVVITLRAGAGVRLVCFCSRGSDLPQSDVP